MFLFTGFGPETEKKQYQQLAEAQNIHETNTPEQSLASVSTEQYKARSFMYRESFLSSTLKYLIRK